MSIDIRVPVLPESVTDATIVTWHKKAGEQVVRDENLVDIETDKVVLEVVAPNDGILEEIIRQEGSVVKAKEIIATFKEGEAVATKLNQSANSNASANLNTDANSNAYSSANTSANSITSPSQSSSYATNTSYASTSYATNPSQGSNQSTNPTSIKKLELTKVEQDISPSLRRLVREHDLDINAIEGSGPNGKLTTEDVENYLKQKTVAAPQKSTNFEILREEKRVPMSRLRARIAERLLQAQHNAAILTTFNEINMQPLMDLRVKYKDQFEKQHGVRLGFMSFFTTAAVEALKRFPEVNASIDGQDIVYHGYFDVGIAVSGPRGLVVPILKDADTLTIADIEKKIRELGDKAKDNQLSIEEITGGTFTISNGGVFGSLMSTPILNPPQSAILGMHKIEERPIVENKQIVIRPMMYVALSYDHRIIDGRESVQFLLTIKEMIEDPARLLLGV